MKKSYKIDVDCPVCAGKMESAAKNTAGVKDASVNFMLLKMKVEFDEGADETAVMPTVLEYGTIDDYERVVLFEILYLAVVYDVI